MNVVSPRTLDEALAALAESGAAQILAGGTDLMVEIDIGRTRPARVVDLWKVDELRGIAPDGDGLRIGALCTCTELLASPLVRERADVLADSVHEFGAVQNRNRATLGGNLGTASPAADLVPALFVLEAVVRLRSAGGAREVAVADFVTGYRANARRPDELIESVWLPRRPAGERRAFRKVGTRRAQSIAKLSLALAVTMEGGRVAALRGAAGSVAERTVPLAELARTLVGRIPDPALVRLAAARTVRADTRARTDVRSTAEYRAAVLERLIVRLLDRLTGAPTAPPTRP